VVSRVSRRSLVAAPRTPVNPVKLNVGTPQFAGSVDAALGYRMPASPATFRVPANALVVVADVCATLTLMF